YERLCRLRGEPRLRDRELAALPQRQAEWGRGARCRAEARALQPRGRSEAEGGIMRRADLERLGGPAAALALLAILVLLLLLAVVRPALGSLRQVETGA